MANIVEQSKKTIDVVNDMREIAEAYLTMEREITLHQDTVNDDLVATSAVIQHTLQSTCDWVCKHVCLIMHGLMLLFLIIDKKSS